MTYSIKMVIKKYFLLIALSFTQVLACAHPSIEIQNSIQLEHEIQPLIKDRYFYNHKHENRLTHSLDALKIFWATKTNTQPYFTTDLNNWLKQDPVIASSTQLQIQWIGHASFLIQVNGFNILTDPVFFDLNKILYPRKSPVGILPAHQPHIDFVIISHNNRDHLDQTSMLTLKHHQPIMLVPNGTKHWFIKNGFKYVVEHNWWQKSTFTRTQLAIDFTFVPATHWSGRNMIDAHASLWGGWIIQAQGQTLYFAGDTGFNQDIFAAIAKYAPIIDCALLPIGPCEPRHLMCHSHMGPEDVIPAFKILKPKLLIPMHWGTFGLGPDSFDAPIKRLDAAWDNHVNIDQHQHLYKIKFGERIDVLGVHK